jgi:hypothetical protein
MSAHGHAPYPDIRAMDVVWFPVVVWSGNAHECRNAEVASWNRRRPFTHRLALPHSASRTIPKSICRVCGTTSSALERLVSANW